MGATRGEHIMGLGLHEYVPLVLYIGLLLSALYALIYRPAVGVIILIPVLPFMSILEKLQPFPFGRNIINVCLVMTCLGWLFGRENTGEEQPLTTPMTVLILTSCIAFVNGLSFKGFSLAYLVDWKDYMLLPLIWLLVVQALRDKWWLKLFTFLLTAGVAGVTYYYVGSLKWMNLAHFSYRVRDAFQGLFLYLGPNHYGAFFVHVFFVLFGLSLFVKPAWQKLVLTALLGVLVYCIMYSYSRGAYMALMGGLIIAGILKERKILVVAFLFLLFWKALVPVSVVERVTMTRDDRGKLEESAADRVMLWQRALDMFHESPLIGKGFNTFAYAGFIDTHNYFLKMLAEQGLMGLSAFLYLLISAMRLAWKLYREADDEFFKGIGFGFALSVFSLMITNFFGDRWSYLCMGSYFWAFMGIMTRSYMINRSQIGERETETVEQFPHGARPAYVTIDDKK